MLRPMDREEWNARYAAQELLWGAEPNRFVAREFGETPARGRALDLACGEGRNAIWLAQRGWSVTAVDYSPVALDRGRRLAATRHVDVEWIEADVVRFVPAPGAFQLVIIAYVHLPEHDRRTMLRHAVAALGPGGTLFMIGHARLNLTHGVGGPQRPELLWEPAELEREVAALGLSVERVEHARRPIETADGVKEAIDTLLRASARSGGQKRKAVDS
jgi:SAM-dependent methyltransferase